MKLRVLIAGLIFGAGAFAADTGAELFQKAITQERAAGNLEEAIKLYQRVAKEFASDRALAAKALVQEARCYEKLGQDKAVKLYEQVARDFADQTEQAAAARERLAALGAGTRPKAGAAMMARQIPIPATAELAGSDGRHVFYVDYEAGGLIAAKMDGTGRRVIVPLPTNRERGIAGSISVSPDGSQVAVNLGDAAKNSFCVAAVDGSGVREIYRKSLRGPQPVGGWSPDGTHFLGHIAEPDGSHALAILSAVDGSLRKIKYDSLIKDEWALTAGGGIFSPDGQYVVFALKKGTGQQSDILILAADGSYAGKLMEHPSFNRPIGFTPDGKHLLYQSDRSGSAGVYTLAVANGKAQGEPVLVKQEAGVFSDAASLTSQGTLFYSLGEQNQHEIFTVGLDAVSGSLAGTPQVFAGPSGMTPESGAWSPDGHRFAYLSGRNHMHGGGDVTLTIRTLASGKEVEYKLPSAVEAVVGWAADGHGVYTTLRFGTRGADLRLELHSVSPENGTDRRLAAIAGARVIYSVRPAPEGNALLIAFGDQPPAPGRPAGLVRLDLQTGQQTEIIPTGVVSEATISPDGTQVAALDRQATSARLLVKPLVGGEWKTLATLDGTGYMYLHWMPNGSLIFGKEGFPNSSLFRIAVSGGTPEKIGTLPFLSHVHEIRVHPDGRQLVFQSYVTHTELWALENFLPKDLAAR